MTNSKITFGVSKCRGIKILDNNWISYFILRGKAMKFVNGIFRPLEFKLVDRCLMNGLDQKSFTLKQEIWTFGFSQDKIRELPLCYLPSTDDNV